MKKTKNKTLFRIDSVLNNERLYIDIRDDIALLQALITDKNLELDYYTMTFIISLRRSILMTYENIGEEVIKIPSNSLYKLRKTIITGDIEIGKEYVYSSPDMALVEENLNEELCDKKEEIEE